MIPTLNQVRNMRHALGLEIAQVAYRNCAIHRGEDSDWEQLCVAGLAHKRVDGINTIYSVSMSGLGWAINPGESIGKEVHDDTYELSVKRILGVAL